MTVLEVKTIQAYINDLDIDEIEFYHELYDHIATAYAERSNRSLAINEFLENEITESFGGEKGIRDAINTQSKAVRNGIYKEAFRHYLSFFSTPKGILKSILTSFFIVLLTSVLPKVSLLSWLVLLGTCLPFLLAKLINWKFRANCRKRKLPFRRSYTNETVVLLSALVIGILQGIPDIANYVLYGQRFSMLKALEGNLTSLYIAAFLFSVYGWVCLEMIWRRTTINKAFASKFEMT